MNPNPLPRRVHGAAPRKRVPFASRWLAAAAVVPALGSLNACGGDDTTRSGADGAADSTYCGALSDTKPHFAALSEGDAEKYDEAFAAFHELAQDAPQSIAADWQAFDGALVNLETALAEVGLEVADLAAVSAGELPAGVRPQDLTKVPDLMVDLLSGGFTTAATNIERHAIEACDIELAV